MKGDTRSLVAFSSTGCLLPFLFFVILIFGRLIFSRRAWLLIAGILLLIFAFKSLLFARKIKSASKDTEVIDVEAEIVDEKDGQEKIDGK